MKKLVITISFLFLLQILVAQVNWKNVSTLGMGYVDGLTINPINNAKYVRTDVGGIFKFDDVNQRWNNLFDNLISMNQRDISSVESFAIDKTTSGNNQVIYALTGNYGYRSYLLKSVNNGQTWTINQDWDTTRKVYGNGAWRCSGEKLAIDPNNNNVVYCGTRFDGLFKTSNAAVNWNQVISFSQTGGYGGLPEKGGISFVVFDPSSTITINAQVVSKNIYVGLIDQGIYRSNDGGTTWCFLNNGFDINLYNPVRAIFENNRLIVALMQDGDGYSDGEIWQFIPNSSDCSGVYSNKTPGLANNYNCPYYGKYMYNALAIRPGFPNTVYAAIRGTMPRKIFYTENFNAQFPNWKILTNEGNLGYLSCLSQFQGSNFTFPTSWVNTEGYDWVGNIEFDQIDNKKLWMTSGNGVLKIEDITSNPAQISSQNVMKDLEILCVNSMISPPLPNTTPLFSNVMDILAVKYQNLDNGNVSKLDPTFGLGAAVSFEYSFQNPNTMALVGQDYNDPVNINRIIKTNDGGTSWQNLYSQPRDCSSAPYGGNIAISSTNINNFIWVPNFISTIPTCLTTIKNQPKFTVDGGLTWNVCNNINFPDGNFPFTFDSRFGMSKCLESDKVNGNKFYYYAMEGQTFLTKLWQTNNSGQDWQAMSSGVLPISGSGQLKANPFLENDIWFAPFNNYILQNSSNPEERKLFRSTDGGITFNSLTSIQEVYAFGFGMKKSGTNVASLIVYGKINNLESIFVSYDLGLTFIDLGTLNIPKGLITNIEGDMKILNRFYASTGCRGGWYGDISTNLNVNNIENKSEKLIIYPNPANKYFKLQLSKNTNVENSKIQIFNILGQEVKTLFLKNIEDEINSSDLDSGIYLIKITDNKKVYSERLIIE